MTKILVSRNLIRGSFLSTFIIIDAFLASSALFCLVGNTKDAVILAEPTLWKVH